MGRAGSRIREEDVREATRLSQNGAHLDAEKPSEEAGEREGKEVDVDMEEGDEEGAEEVGDEEGDEADGKLVCMWRQTGDCRSDGPR